MKSIDSVLVVEDDEGLRELFVRILRNANFEVEEACEGRAAIKALERRPFAVVLTDIIMDGKEGIETIVQIKFRWPECRIIAVSGGGRSNAGDFLSVALQLGADAALRKPVGATELVTAIRGLLEGGETVTGEAA